MRNIKIKRFISYVLILAIAISTFHVTGEGYIAKAEENENVEDTAVAEQELIEEAVTEEQSVEINDVENSGITEYSEVNNTQESDTDYEQIQETEAVQESGVEEDIQEEVKTDEAQENTPETEREYAGDGYTVKFVLDNQWESGFNATVTIINTSDAKIENWSMVMPLHNGFSNIWNAVLADSYEDFYVIKNAGWNQDIPINGSVSFGMTSYEKFAGFPEYYTMLGKKVETKTSDYVVEYTITDAWEDGLIGQIQITNMRDTAIEDWRLHFCYEGEIVDIWDGVILSYENGIYEISCEKYNQNIPAGASVTFGFKISSGDVGEPTDLVLEEYADGEETYIAVMGELTEEGIWLNTISSPLCETYTYYISLDGKDYSELETTDESEYLYKDTGDNDKRVYIYVAGKNKGEILKSENVIIEYAKGEYTITNYDTDGDLLCDYLEYCCDTDVRNKDTDGDGLTDYDEIYKTMTDPLSMDTDDDGISDYYMDIEGEGLQNWEELKNGTNPISSDTDEDNLTDYEELYVYGTDPLVADTDNDGLSDYDDVKLGFDPLLPDTDGNGILDGDEKVEQTVTYEFDNQEHPGVRAVSVTLTAAGNIEDKIYMEDMYGLDAMSSDVVGLYGIPVEIQCDVPFDTARLTFKYDESYLDGTEEDDLSIMWYNQAEEWYQILDEDCVIDKQENTVSYVTTHFSTYMLVRSSEWYNAWRENIDYRCSDENNTNKHYFDIAFVVDTSRSMSGKRMTATKTALNKFVDSMESADSAALIGFSGSAKKYCDFTSNKSSLKTGINNLKATGLTSVSAGMRVAVNMFKNRISSKEKVMVLICDGDVDKVQSLVDECVENKIKIYVVNISNESTHSILEKMAKSTGGEYYFGNSANDVTTKMYKIQGSTTDKIDVTDTDRDGLYNVFEKAGMKCPNGRIIYTNYMKKDTDGDGLNDYEETGIVYSIDNRYIGKGTHKTIKYFKLKSDPTMEDSDLDGIKDADDDNPWKCDVFVIEQLKLPDYLNVANRHGGNQDWWESKIKAKKPKNTKSVNIPEYLAFRKDKYYRLCHFGCGVIAMSDLELYLAVRNKNYSLSYSNMSTSKNDFAKDEYMDYVEEMFDKKYKIEDSIPDYFIGLDPGDMEIGLSSFLKKNGYNYSWVEWARYGFDDSQTQRINVLEDTKNMLHKDIPVVFSYHNKEKGIPMYENLTDMKKYLENNNNAPTPSSKPESHYMTIIGIMKMYVNGSYKKILKVVSWGEVYYISYDEYSKYLNFFTNILSVY